MNTCKANSTNEDIGLCIGTAIFGGFETDNHKIEYGWLFYDTGSNLLINNECPKLVDGYEVTIDMFTAAFGVDFGDLTVISP